MLRIEITPSLNDKEFDVIVELDRTGDIGDLPKVARELSCGFTVEACTYDSAVLAAFPRIQQVLEVFQPPTVAEKDLKEAAKELQEDLEGFMMLSALQEIFGKDNVRRVPISKKPPKPEKADFFAHDHFDNIWDEIERNYSLGEK